MLELQKVNKLMVAKNSKILTLSEQFMELQSMNTATTQDVNCYDVRVLTDADWITFPGYFENVHAGDIQRLGKKILSESEERLFLFIKLRLNQKETATILGISAASVKKTRNRLRKRLGLSSEYNLDDYVHGFQCEKSENLRT